MGQSARVLAMFRRFSLSALAAALLFAGPAAAQGKARDNDHDHQHEHTHPPLPKVPKNLPGGLTFEFEEAVREGLPSPEELAAGVALDFFTTLLAGDARTIAKGSVVPFALEDRRVSTREELEAEWIRHLRGKRLDLHVLYGIEVFTPEQMEKKHGKPPERLKGLPWKDKGVWIAVANLSGRPAVAIFKEVAPGELLLAGFHD